ncbi:beta-1,4-galactosyltransferase 4-like [Pelodytes ibericus]
MGLRNVFTFQFCKFKSLMLMTLGVMLVGLSSMYIFEMTHYIPKYLDSAGNLWKGVPHKDKKEGKAPLVTTIQKSNKKICPALTPYLKGVVPLSFDPSITLEKIKKNNNFVAKGKFHPRVCQAQQKVAVIIPHRNREKHLLYLLHNLHPFLQRQQLEYGIYVIHQSGEAKFNRAKLLNIGYLEALKEKAWDCFIFHDVDLVPENDFNLYLCDNEPKHLVVGRNHTKYKLLYRSYFGGVTALTRDQFAKVNGYSNNYWGWGSEDDDLRKRVLLNKMKTVQPFPDIGKYTMIFHTRDVGNEANPKRMQLIRNVSKVWKKDGLNSCSYKLLSIRHNTLYINITADVGKPNP